MPYPADFMYDIVNDVDSYPDFLPWCAEVKVHQVDDVSMEASILMRGIGLNHWLKTRNSMVAGESIDMALVEGPFSKLEGHWEFTPIANEGCKIELVMQFEIEKSITAALIAPAFSHIANSMVDSFCNRAREQYDR